MDKVYNHFQKVDPVLFEHVHYLENFKLEKSDDYYRSLVRSIVGQQLSTKVAAVIFNRLLHLFPNEEVTPDVMAKIKDGELRSIGMSWGKVKYVKDLSQKVLTGELDLSKVDSMSNEEVISTLTKVRGIGSWTAEMFMMFTLARPDIFSFGDLGLKNAIRNLYGIENPTQKDLEELSAKWSPYRTYAALVLWDSLDNKPQ